MDVTVTTGKQQQGEDSSKTAAVREGEGVAGASSSSSSSKTRVDDDTNKRRRLNEDSAKEKLAQMMMAMQDIQPRDDWKGFSVSEDVAQDFLMLLESKDAVIAKKDAIIANKDAIIASDQITFEAQSEQLWKKDKLLRMYDENNILLEQYPALFQYNVGFKLYSDVLGSIVASWHLKHSDQGLTVSELEREITNLIQPFRERVSNYLKNLPKVDKQQDEDQEISGTVEPSDEYEKLRDILQECFDATLKYLSNKFRRSSRPTMEPMVFQVQKFLYLEVAKRTFRETVLTGLWFEVARLVWPQLLNNIIENTKVTLVANYAVVTVPNPGLVLTPRRFIPSYKVIPRNSGPVADHSLQEFYDAFYRYLEGINDADIFGDGYTDVLKYVNMAGKGDMLGEIVQYEYWPDHHYERKFWALETRQLGGLLCRLQPYFAHIATAVKPGFESQLYILKKMVLHVTLDYFELDPELEIDELACIMNCHEQFMNYALD